MNTEDFEVLSTADQWLAAGLKVFLVTVVNTWGASPRPEGSLMVVCEDGKWAGSVSGGCLEHELIEHLRRGAVKQTELLVYGESEQSGSRRLLPCGATLKLVIEPLAADSLRPVLDALQGRQRIERSLKLDSGEVSLRPPGSDQSCCFDGQNLVRVFGPRFRLLLVGAGDVSHYLAELAQGLDFEVIVNEPRSEYAELWSCPGAGLDTGAPDDAVRAHVRDACSAVVTLTHDPKLDEMALLEALPADAFYVGALGSRKTNASRCERLSFMGVSDRLISRLHAPVGLDIGSHTPAEIAVSIMAELIKERHRLLVGSN